MNELPSCRRLRAAVHFFVIAALGAAVGCKQVGSPLVDTLPPDPPTLGGGIMCAEPPICTVHDPELTAAPARNAELVDLASCGGVNLDPCDDPGDATADDDAGIDTENEACAAGSSAIERSAKQLARSSLSCESLHILVTDTDEPELVIEKADWRDVNVVLESERPLRVVLRAPSLLNVFFSLGGPVTLRVEDALTFERVKVASSQHSGRPRLEIDVKSAKDFLVGGHDAPFAGEVAIKRGQLDTSQLAADVLWLESVIMTSERISANQLYISDSMISNTRLETSDAVVSATDMHRGAILRCSTLALIDSNLYDTNIVACDAEPLRVYDSTLSAGYVDGEIESDESDWYVVEFGTRSETKLEMWKGSILSSNFCTHTVSVALSQAARCNCSRCDDGGLSEPGAVCKVPGPGKLRQSNEMCPAFDDIEDCTEPIPVRERPQH